MDFKDKCPMLFKEQGLPTWCHSKGIWLAHLKSLRIYLEGFGKAFYSGWKWSVSSFLCYARFSGSLFPSVDCIGCCCSQLSLYPGDGLISGLCFISSEKICSIWEYSSHFVHWETESEGPYHIFHDGPIMRSTPGYGAERFFTALLCCLFDIMHLKQFPQCLAWCGG